MTPPAPRPNLLADCSSCFGLCCVALPFARSSDFAVNKDAGEPCRNLQEDFRCGIHTKLRSSGFRGCTVYDCFGAGQKVSQHTFGGRSWREDTALAGRMFEVFPVVRALHELLWYLTEAVGLPAAEPVRTRLQSALHATEALAGGSADELAQLDVDRHRGQVNEVLLAASDLVRAQAKGKKRNYRGADLVGKKLTGIDLTGASFRGAYLVAADMRGSDLRFADMIGADLRDTDLSGADLRKSLFLTQFQINAAKGDAETRIPDVLERPSHWPRT
ncbi:pentapeptide repeat-containing protein [Rhodococcus sp. PAMC28707]|uniref:pentapeptide repeat-containing protein n=1 Tax=unclassified Rhodococcus (in: high G+C Gram-positive bacteria) TaxID=192944 RepID=UPI00109D9C6C|nr:MULTISPECIES: pentapeptide repeat-containing protein [unclassified Rhodococcus (in: high G+C Gram-positive bacteria)]QCB49734.1 pentapeptide repeat-containing protein [Rhodococcus sp. PAMC28705]QCB58573.1 pentapeptide repeat-containing protein [Rhodococcus sp. PAMC28707]